MKTPEQLLMDYPRVFKELMEYREKVFIICLGFSRNLQDAEELTQEVYLKALKKIATLKDSNWASTWLIRIARNTCLDHTKKNHHKYWQRVKLEIETVDYDTPEIQTSRKELLYIVKKAIKLLPRKLQDVLVLKEYGDLSYREISIILRIKEGTVMSRLNRARQALRVKIQGESHE